jgi:hypothetical protein
MLRILLLLLLLANGAFHAWTQGWLAPWLPPPSDQREPERLANQVHPELITVLTPNAATQAVAAAASRAADTGRAAEADVAVCLEAGPFTETSVVVAETALAQHGVPEGAVVREAVASAFTWGVVMGRFPDRESMRSKADELRRLGVAFDELSAPASLAPALRLGNYSDRYGAEAALNQLARQGVRTARVVQLPSGPVRLWLRADRADAELQTRLRSLSPGPLAAGFVPCAERKA